MNKFLLNLLIIILLFTSSIKAQIASSKMWDKTIGGTNEDILTSIQQTSDGGYILGGTSYSGIGADKNQTSRGSSDYWIVKTDSLGNKIWEKTFGGDQLDYLAEIQQTSDGGYILGGYSRSGISGDKSQASRGNHDYWIVKLDPNGNKIWDKTFGGVDDDFLYSLKHTSDGGYILGGWTLSGSGGDKSQPSRGQQDCWVLKLDVNGMIQWEKTIGGNGYDRLYSIQQTSDGGYIFGGYSNSGISGEKSQNPYGSFSTDFWIVKLNATGDKVWDKTLGGNGDDGLYSLQQTSDGGYILGGTSYSGIGGDKSQASRGSSDYWVVKTDINGNKVWEKTFGGISTDGLNSITQSADGGYLMGGWSYSGIGGDKSQVNQGDSDYWVLKIGSNGNLVWDKTIGGNDRDGLYSLQQTSDGGYILGGASYSGLSGDKSQPTMTQGFFDYWVVKLAPSCADLSATLKASCNSAGTQVSVNIIGIQPSTPGSPAWTLIYTVNGITQTATGSSSNFILTQNAAVGSVYSLVSVVSGTCSANLTNSLTVQPVPGAPIVTPGFRCGSGIVILSATGAPTGGRYVWYNTASGQSQLENSGSGIFITPSISNTTTYYVATTNNAGCEGPRTAVVANITNLTASAGPPQIICESAAPIQLTGFSPAGGTWSGTGVSPSGLFTPAKNLIGNRGLTYTVTQNGCSASAVQIITVTAQPIVNAGQNQTICSLAAPVQLTGFSPSGGTWTGPGVSASGLFTPSPNLVGNQNLTYSFTQNGCTATSTKIIMVIAPQVINVGPPQSICIFALPVQLSGFSPAGGTWSGAGVSASGLFTPASNLIGNQNLTYTVTQNGCVDSATKIISVTAAPIVISGKKDTVCAHATPYQLSGFSPLGGTWSGSGVNATGLFTPTIALAGTQNLIYSFTQNGCTVTSTKQIVIPTPPVQPFITLHSSDTLIASLNGSSYEWRLNNMSLPITTKKLKVTASGTYSVRVRDNYNCASAYSADYIYIFSGFKNELENQFKLYPNPTTGLLTLELKDILAAEVKILNSLSQQVMQKMVKNPDEKVQLDLTKLAKGIYLIQLKTDNQSIVKKIVVE